MHRLDRRHFLGGLAACTLAPNAALPAQEPVEDLATIGRTAHTRFAINAEMWLRDRPFLDRLRAIAAMGFPAAEFWPWRGKDLEAIRAVCEETGLEIAQFTAWGFVPGMNEPEHLDRFLQEIEASCKAAQLLRCKKMTVVGGNDVEGRTRAQMHANIIVALKHAAPIAEEHDVMLILEPMNVRVDHPGHCLFGSPDAVRICRKVDSTHVKINWDLYHMQISEGDLCGRLREGFDQVGYLQLADHPGRNEPGTGEIHYPRVLREAWELGYRGFVGAECRPLDDDVAAARRLAAAGQW